MSTRRPSKPSNVRRTPAGRGPSRPIDPRRAPGRPQRRGIDTTGIALLVGSGIVVLILAVVLALQLNNRNASTTTTIPLNFPSVTPNWTQTTVAFETVTAPSLIPRISIKDTKALMDSNSALVFDVRVADMYKQGHVKGAANLPYNELVSRMKEIPRTGNVLLYCECPHDEESASVAFALKQSGYTNMKVIEGPFAMTAWKNAGYPVEP